MAKEIIAVDVDDVLADHAEAWLEWTNKKYGTNLGIEDYSDHWSVVWQTDHEETEKRADEFHATGVHRKLTTKPDSLEVLRELKKKYDLVIVTARVPSIVKDSKEWLNEFYGGLFSDIRFVPIWDKDNTLTKAAICQELGAGYLIDDLMRHCKLAAEAGLEGLLFGDYSWNRSEELPDGVTRVRNWLEVKEYFNAKR